MFGGVLSYPTLPLSNYLFNSIRSCVRSSVRSLLCFAYSSLGSLSFRLSSPAPFCCNTLERVTVVACLSPTPLLAPPKLAMPPIAPLLALLLRPPPRGGKFSSDEEPLLPPPLCCSSLCELLPELMLWSLPLAEESLKHDDS